LKKLKWNENWSFTSDDLPGYRNNKYTEGQVVTFPHSFNAFDNQGGDSFFRGKCWYQKTLLITSEDLSKHIFLEIGAASLQSEVYLNGNLIKKNKTGYSLYRAHLNPYLEVGENLISIAVDNSEDNRVYPLMADFNFYGGIYRDVNLIFTENLHFDLLDHSRDGIYITNEKIANNIFTMKISGNIINECDEEVDAQIKMKLINQDQNIIFEKLLSTKVLHQHQFEIKEDVEDPILWNGMENPYLYTFEATILINDIEVDKRVLSTGFRTVEITPDSGVYLNGSPIKLNGVSRHQDFHLVGNALTKAHMDQDMELIKEIGSNSIRLAHYQHDDYFYTLCDEAGLLVWAEIPFISVPTTSDESNQNAKDQLEALIKQTQNHVSVYCYGVQNEITIAVEDERIYEMTKELEVFAKELAPTHYSAQANIYSVDNTSPLNEITDFIGYNLYYGWYYGELMDLGKRLDEFHKEKPNIPVMVTEYGVDTNIKFHSYEPKVKDYTEEYQLLFHNNALKTIEEREFVLGGYQWNMFDFGSAMRDEGGMKGINQKGLVTFDRKVKKDAFYLYKAYWSKEPFVKIAGSRFLKRHQKNNDIVVLSNLVTLKLYRNGELISQVESSAPMTTFKSVEFSAGENLIEVQGLTVDGTIFKDEALFHYQNEPEVEYTYVNEVRKKHVTNWFEKFDLTSVEEIELKDGYYSTFDTIETLLNNNETKEVIFKYFEKTFDHPRFRAMKGLITIENMAKIKSAGIPQELLLVINKELNTIKKQDYFETISPDC
jgi:beta-galactosidase